MANDITLRNLWRMPTISLPTWEEVEDMLPTSSLLNGLSVSEDDKHIYIEAAVPGVDPAEIEVLYQKGVLTIRAEKKEEEKQKRYQRKATSSFLYRVEPGDVDPTKEPKAEYKNGIMHISFAKAPEAKPMKIAVKAL